MARKKKVVVNQQELTPTVLAVKADKKKSSILGLIWISFIFIVFIGSTIYIQDISSFVKQFIMPEKNISYVPSKSSKTTKDDETKNTDSEENVYKEYTEGLEFKIGSLVFKNFNITDNNLVLTISNETTTSIRLSDYNYYMTLYSAEKEVLQIIRLGNDTVFSSDSITKSYYLDNTNIGGISITNYKKSDYPAYTLKSNDSGIGTLTCYDSLGMSVYSFKNNKLYSIARTITLLTTAEDYETKAQEYRSAAERYDKIEGITSSAIESGGAMSFKTIVDLSINGGKEISYIASYANGTEPRIVYFELSASGYKCN